MPLLPGEPAENPAPETKVDPATEAGSMAPGYARGSYYSWSRSRWHSRGANPYPKRTKLFDDLPGLIRDWIVPGHAPPAGILRLEDSIVTLGSCFARELREHLNAQGVSARNLWIPAGLNNTFAILDFISWCVTGQQTGRGFRYDTTEDGEIRDWTPEVEAESYLRWIRETDAFVFTLGLAEVWQDTDTGQVFWRGVPKELYEADRHVFRLTTVEENEANIEQILGESERADRADALAGPARRDIPRHDVSHGRLRLEVGAPRRARPGSQPEARERLLLAVVRDRQMGGGTSRVARVRDRRHERAKRLALPGRRNRPGVRRNLLRARSRQQAAGQARKRGRPRVCLSASSRGEQAPRLCARSRGEQTPRALWAKQEARRRLRRPDRAGSRSVVIGV